MRSLYLLSWCPFLRELESLIMTLFFVIRALEHLCLNYFLFSRFIISKFISHRNIYSSFYLDLQEKGCLENLRY